MTKNEIKIAVTYLMREKTRAEMAVANAFNTKSETLDFYLAEQNEIKSVIDTLINEFHNAEKEG